jgi:hypothetical protein
MKLTASWDLEMKTELMILRRSQLHLSDINNLKRLVTKKENVIFKELFQEFNIYIR